MDVITRGIFILEVTIRKNEREKIYMNLKTINKTLCATALASVLALTGCGNNSNDETVKNVNLNDVHNAVVEAYGEDYIPSYEFDAAYISEVFGLSEDMYDEIIAQGPKVSFNIDTFVAVKAKEGKGEEVYNILDSYRKSQIEDAMQYPTNAIKIQSSQVTRHGDYVFFTCLGVISSESEEAGDEAILNEAKEDNAIAVDTIDKFFE